MGKYNFEQLKSNYKTPPELITEGLKLVGRYYGEKHFGGLSIFDLDTCCSDYHIPATDYYKYGEKDGLKENWKSINWCNPPYEECIKWIKKAFEEQQKGNTTVMLLPVRTETKYWHDYILFNPNVEIHWLRKGYRFIDADSGEKMGIFKNALSLVVFKGAEV